MNKRVMKLYTKAENKEGYTGFEAYNAIKKYRKNTFNKLNIKRIRGAY